LHKCNQLLADWESKIGVLSESGEIGYSSYNFQSTFSAFGRA